MTFPTGIEVSRQNLGLGAVKSGELLLRSQGMVGLAIPVVALCVAWRSMLLPYVWPGDTMLLPCMYFSLSLSLSLTLSLFLSLSLSLSLSLISTEIYLSF